MSDEMKRLLDKLDSGIEKTKNKMLFFRASQEMLDVLDYIIVKYGGELTRSEIIRVGLIHGLTDLLKEKD